jgi:hypothetical protein
MLVLRGEKAQQQCKHFTREINKQTARLAAKRNDEFNNSPNYIPAYGAEPNGPSCFCGWALVDDLYRAKRLDKGLKWR